jgi:tRNA (mo5U34)-methyltransferase
VPHDLRGKRALDIGTWDGPVAFELEKRGADVDAIDVQDPSCTAFSCAHALRKSKVRYTQMSVYDIPKQFPYKFDVIFFFGVYYHLKHPLLAFEALADALADGGRIFFEGELLLTYSETNRGERSKLNNRALAESGVPLSLCYTGDFRSTSNWFVPNLACLRGWFEAAGLEITNYGLYCVPQEVGSPAQRISGVARKSAELGTVEEVGIFNPNLGLTEQHWDAVNVRRSRHNQEATDVANIRRATKIWKPPGWFATTWRKIIGRVPRPFKRALRKIIGRAA